MKFYIKIRNSILIALGITILFVIVDAFQEWEAPELHLSISIKTSADAIAQVFYDVGNDFNQGNSATTRMFKGPAFQELLFPMPDKKIRAIRFDPVQTEAVLYIEKVQITDGWGKVLKPLDLNGVKPMHQIQTFEQGDSVLKIETIPDAEDPMLSVPFEYSMERKIKNFILHNIAHTKRAFVVVFLLAFTAMYFAFSDFEKEDEEAGDPATTTSNEPSHFFSFIYLKIFHAPLFFVKLILQKRHLIFSMAKREVATQYIGSLLGFIWTFINPLVLIFVFWVVFSVGFKVKPTNNVPFVVWLTAGMAAWFVFSEIVSGSSGIVVANAHLIKKTLFPSQVLPIVKLVSCLITHAVFLFVLLGLIIIHKMPLNLYYLQFIYYLVCLSILGIGIGWAVSALNVFIRDVGQIVAVVLQVGFWATPIFWDINIMPAKVQLILKLNPMYYIVQGYRESFIYFEPFWRHPIQTVYFWCVTTFLFFVGAIIFKKLKPQFADVL